MANATSREFIMTQDGDRYTFTHQDMAGRNIKVEGTIKEMSFTLFKQYMETDQGMLVLFG
jgi:hypothetical protein